MTKEAMSISATLQEVLTFDEGSLPGFYFEDLSSDKVQKIYAYIREKSERPADDFMVWSNAAGKDVSLNLIEDVAQKIASGEITPVCHPVVNFIDGKVATNCASIFLFSDGIEIFYDPREMRSGKNAIGLLNFVRKVTRVAGVQSPYIGDEVGSPREHKYQHAIRSVVES
jgi:hypothetical protein